MIRTLNDTLKDKEHNLDLIFLSKKTTPLWIGKSEICDIVLDREIPESTSVAQTHAELIYLVSGDGTGHWYIKDKDSVHGIRLYREGISVAIGLPHRDGDNIIQGTRLKPGDKIFLGSYGPLNYEEERQNE